jgi:hypothetical protein
MSGKAAAEANLAMTWRRVNKKSMHGILVEPAPASALRWPGG